MLLYDESLMIAYKAFRPHQYRKVTLLFLDEVTV